MAELTKEEAAELKRLTEKTKAPDAPAVARSVNVSVDLGDPDQVDRAVKLGLPGFDVFGSNGDEEDEESEGDEPPERKGFFEKDK